MTLTIELPDEQTAALSAKARAQGLSAEDGVKDLPPIAGLHSVDKPSDHDVPPGFVDATQSGRLGTSSRYCISQLFRYMICFVTTVTYRQAPP